MRIRQGQTAEREAAEGNPHVCCGVNRPVVVCRKLLELLIVALSLHLVFVALTRSSFGS